MARHPNNGRVDFPESSTYQLEYGAYSARVARPDQDTDRLGARYVHGGYVLEWWHGDTCLTGSPNPEWKPYEGAGLPEVFEWGLGWQDAAMGEPFMRIGAGQALKTEGLNEGGGPLVQPLTWLVRAQEPHAIVMECADEQCYGNRRYAYWLERTIRLEGASLTSRTRLRVECPWNTPVNWFAHPFFRQTRMSESLLGFPGGGTEAFIQGEMRAREVGHGFADTEEPSRIARLLAPGNEFEVRQPAHGFAVTVDHPVDHYVVFATPRVFSVEPQIARAWPSGATLQWSIRYRHDLGSSVVEK